MKNTSFLWFRIAPNPQLFLPTIFILFSVFTYDVAQMSSETPAGTEQLFLGQHEGKECEVVCINLNLGYLLLFYSTFKVAEAEPRSAIGRAPDS